MRRRRPELEWNESQIVIVFAGIFGVAVLSIGESDLNVLENCGTKCPQSNCFYYSIVLDFVLRARLRNIIMSLG